MEHFREHRIGTVGVLMCLALLSSCLGVRGVPARALRIHKITSEEQQVLLAVGDVETLYKEAVSLWQRETITPEPPSPCRPHFDGDWNLDQLIRAPRALVFKAPPDVLLVSEEERKLSQAQTVPKTWQPKRLPPVNTFSRVSFDRKSGRALVYEQTECGPLCGGGRFLLFAREARKWRLLKTYCTWAS